MLTLLITTNLRYVFTGTLLLLYSLLQAQQFWLTTYEFPGGPKTAIALKDDSTMFVATAAGIIRSYNQANKFDTCFTNPEIQSLHGVGQLPVYGWTDGRQKRAALCYRCR